MGIGLLELVIIAVAALVLLGPERLPEVLRQLGKLYVQLRRTSNEFRGVFDHMVRQAEEELRMNEIKKLTDLANQGSKIAQNAAEDLQRMNQDYHNAPVSHDIGSHHRDLDPAHEHHVPPLQAPPPGREAHAVDAWDHHASPEPHVAQTEPVPPHSTPETKP